MALGSIGLSTVSQKEKDKLRMIFLIWGEKETQTVNNKCPNTTETENCSSVKSITAEGGVEGKRAGVGLWDNGS